MARVFVAGSFNLDHVWRVEVLPMPGATLSGRYASGPGGKGFNQAVAACRAGAETRFVCALGDDPAGQLARALCNADGIELHATISDEPTGTAGIFVDDAGRNCIVIGPGANATLTPGGVAQALSGVARGDVVLTQLESPLDAVTHALTTAHKAGALALLNPAPANVAITPELLSLADVLTPNETEFAALLTRHCGVTLAADAVAGLDDAQLHALCQQLLPQGSVVVTLGAAGCFVSHSEDLLRGDEAACCRIAAEPAQAIDTTGAGDAFNGALAASLAQQPHRAFIAHARFAGRYAARSTEREGAALAMPRMQVD